MSTRRSGSSRPTLAAVLSLLAIAAATGCVGKADRLESSPGTMTEESSTPVPSGEVDPTPSSLASSSSSSSSAATDSTTRPVDPLVWSGCGDGFDCAQLEVPLDHGDPTGSTLSLALIRRPATGEASGSIFVNPGGPGASGVEYVRSGFLLDAETMSHYDLIGFDPRGIGSSSPLRCRLDRTAGPLPDLEPDTRTEAGAVDRWARSEAETCSNADGARLGHQTTVDVAEDLDLARRAVGDDKLNYLGLSYGTRLGLVYASLHPDRVGRMVLDGIVDPDADLAGLLQAQATGFDEAFASLVADCDPNSPDRPADCPDEPVDQIHDRLMSRLETAPVGGVGPTELSFATVLSLYNPALRPPYLQALRAAEAGDFAPLERLSDYFASAADPAAYLSVLCSDSATPTDSAGWTEMAQAMDATSDRFGAPIANETRACASWPFRSDAPSGTVAFDLSTVDAPIVLIGATGDPATPLANARSVAERLPAGRLVVVEAQEHTSYARTGCVGDLVAAYFNEGVLPEDGTRCKNA